jgi:DNA-binding IclR family transcriptional regulator
MDLLDLQEPPGFTPVPAIVRAVAILDYVASKSAPVGLNFISRDLGLPKSSTLGICRTLTGEGLLVQDERRKYSLGIRVVRLASRHVAGLDLAQVFHRLLDSRPSVKKTLQLAVLDGNHVVYLARRDAPNGLALPSTTGRALPASTTSVGKILLAFLEPERLRALYPNDGALPQNTYRSRTSFSELVADLTLTRERGYAIDQSETIHGVLAVGAPIFAYGEPAPVGAISIAEADNGPVSQTYFDELGTEVIGFAKDFSSLLGG